MAVYLSMKLYTALVRPVDEPSDGDCPSIRTIYTCITKGSGKPASPARIAVQHHVFQIKKHVVRMAFAHPAANLNV